MKTFNEFLNESCETDELSQYEFAVVGFKAQHFQQYRSIYETKYLDQCWQFATGDLDDMDDISRNFHNLMQLIIVSASFVKSEF